MAEMEKQLAGAEPDQVVQMADAMPPGTTTTPSFSLPHAHEPRQSTPLFSPESPRGDTAMDLDPPQLDATPLEESSSPAAGAGQPSTPPDIPYDALRSLRTASPPAWDRAPWLHVAGLRFPTLAAWKDLYILGKLHQELCSDLSVADWLIERGCSDASELSVGQALLWFRERSEREMNKRDKGKGKEVTRPPAAKTAPVSPSKRGVQTEASDTTPTKKIKVKNEDGLCVTPVQGDGMQIDLTAESDEDEGIARPSPPWTDQQDFIMLCRLISQGKFITSTEVGKGISHRCTAQFKEAFDRWIALNLPLDKAGEKCKYKGKQSLVLPNLEPKRASDWARGKTESLWQAVLGNGARQPGVFEGIAEAVSKYGPRRTAQECKREWQEELAPHFGFNGR